MARAEGRVRETAPRPKPMPHPPVKPLRPRVAFANYAESERTVVDDCPWFATEEAPEPVTAPIAQVAAPVAAPVAVAAPLAPFASAPVAAVPPPPAFMFEPVGAPRAELSSFAPVALDTFSVVEVPAALLAAPRKKSWSLMVAAATVVGIAMAGFGARAAMHASPTASAGISAAAAQPAPVAEVVRAVPVSPKLTPAEIFPVDLDAVAKPVREARPTKAARESHRIQHAKIGHDLALRNAPTPLLPMPRAAVSAMAAPDELLRMPRLRGEKD